MTGAGNWRLNLIGNISNTYNIHIGQQEELTNDLETFRGSLIASYVLPEGARSCP